MNKSGRRLIIVASVVVALVVLTIVNFFVYPFQSAKPNFADVERVFNKIEIPTDWVEISSSENRGIAGRACPIEGSGCFSKSKRFSIDPSTPSDNIASVYKTSGCTTISIKEDAQTEGVPPIRFRCSIDGLTVGGDYYRDEKEITINILSY